MTKCSVCRKAHSPACNDIMAKLAQLMSERTPSELELARQRRERVYAAKHFAKIASE